MLRSGCGSDGDEKRALSVTDSARVRDEKREGPEPVLWFPCFIASNLKD